MKLTDYSEQYGFKESDRMESLMVINDCSFMTTKYKNVYITDYDFRTDQDLKPFDLLNLVYKNGLIKIPHFISISLLENEALFNKEIIKFIKDIN